jgi:AraC-like DNA-binding protein
MKSIQEQLLIPENEIFLLKRNQGERFSRVRHHHRELEIKYMVSGSGRGFIGETIYEYQAGDLVLIGPNLPHHWVSANHYEEKGILADCFYLQFKEDFLGDNFLQKNVTLEIASLFQRARAGIQFFGSTAQHCYFQLLELSKAVGIQRLIGFIQLLDTLAHSLEYRLFENKHEFEEVVKNPEKDRLNRIYKIIEQNFQYEIDLETIAKEVGMSKSAFCQFFKKRTLKSFTEFVNELRIANAQRLLITTDLSIKEIAYQSGFNNLSLFNRVFKQETQLTPKEYQKQFKV